MKEVNYMLMDDFIDGTKQWEPECQLFDSFSNGSAECI